MYGNKIGFTLYADDEPIYLPIMGVIVCQKMMKQNFKTNYSPSYIGY